MARDIEVSDRMKKLLGATPRDVKRKKPNPRLRRVLKTNPLAKFKCKVCKRYYENWATTLKCIEWHIGG